MNQIFSLILLILSATSVYCRHEKKSVQITERANFNPNGNVQNPADYLRAAAGIDANGNNIGLNYNNQESDAAKLLAAATAGQSNGGQGLNGQLNYAQGNGQQQQLTPQQQQIQLLQQMIEQQRQQNLYNNQRQNVVGTGLGGQGLAPGQVIGGQVPQYGQQQQPQYGQPNQGQGQGQNTNVDLGIGGILESFNPSNLGGPFGLGPQFGLPLTGAGQSQQSFGPPKHTRVNVPFFFNMDLDKSGNDQDANTKMALSSMGGLIRVNLDRTTNKATGQKSGPVGVWVGPIKVAGRR